ncbi:hypothetical protein SAM_1264 [Streptococcus agalactiae CJB111]|nr:hypothetical protein SAM_1264 [Streptococcus agalactiae CJB111]
MYFIKEENNISCFLNFFYDILNIFFKTTPILGASFKARDIYRNDFFIFDSSRDITIYNCLCQTFNNSCFTNTCITN